MEAKATQADTRPMCPLIHRPGYKRYPKPPYSYVGIIATSILNTPEKRDTLRGIIDRVTVMFPFFSGEYKGWHDSVRHSLSHRECFVKVSTLDHSRFSFWTVVIEKLPRNAFKRQDTAVAKSGKWAPDIHQQLKLTPVDLPPFVPKSKPSLYKKLKTNTSILKHQEDAINILVKPNRVFQPVYFRNTPDCRNHIIAPESNMSSSNYATEQTIRLDQSHFYTVENIARYRNEILRHTCNDSPELFRPMETCDLTRDMSFDNDTSCAPLDLHLYAPTQRSYERDYDKCSYDDNKTTTKSDCARSGDLVPNVSNMALEQFGLPAFSNFLADNPPTNSCMYSQCDTDVIDESAQQDYWNLASLYSSTPNYGYPVSCQQAMPYCYHENNQTTFTSLEKSKPFVT